MSQETGPQGPDPAVAAAARKSARTRWLLRLAAAVVIIGLAWLAYWFFIGRSHVSTEDAYVDADVAQITSLVSGAIIDAPVGETEVVKKGQVLAVIDPADYKLAVERARAELGQTERRVRQYFANEQALAAETTARSGDIARGQAQVTAAQAELTRAEAELTRRRNLAGSGAVSADELTEAQTRAQTARANLTAAQAGVTQARAAVTAAGEQRRSAGVLVAGTSVGEHPEVAAARARLHQAELDLSRTVVRSPVDGVVAQGNIEVGQRVQTGQRMMSVVALHTAYVDANFKEVQLKNIHIGSPVTVTSDLYGGSVKYHGQVVGIGGGTGSAFALIPAQNATGNWIKVVQRVPVRIKLDPKEVQAHPLRVGLSMSAEVEVR